MRLIEDLPISYFAVIIFLCGLCLIPDSRTDMGFALMAGWIVLLPVFMIVTKAPTILVYSIALLPIFYAWKGYRPKLMLACAGMALAVGVAFIPGLISQYQYRAMQLDVREDDVSVPVKIKPRTFKLTGFSNGGIRVDGHWRNSCELLCSDLLLKAGADTVYVAGTNTPGDTAYRVGRRDHCGQKASNPFAVNDCFIAEDVSHSDPDVEIKRLNSIDSQRLGVVDSSLQSCQPGRHLTLINPSAVGYIELSERVDGYLQLAERVTMLYANVAPTPFIIDWVSCGQFHSEMHLASVHIDSEKIDTRKILTRRYGLSFDG